MRTVLGASFFVTALQLLVAVSPEILRLFAVRFISVSRLFLASVLDIAC